VTVSFTDASKVKSTYPAVTTDSSGNFSGDQITIPAGAAAGKAKVTVTSVLTARYSRRR
jgi:hypothetical protein